MAGGDWVICCFIFPFTTPTISNIPECKSSSLCVFFEQVINLLWLKQTEDTFKISLLELYVGKGFQLRKLHGKFHFRTLRRFNWKSESFGFYDLNQDFEIAFITNTKEYRWACELLVHTSRTLFIPTKAFHAKKNT